MNKDTELEISRRMRRFMIWMYVVGLLMGIVASIAYVAYLQKNGGWDPSTSFFHAIVLLFGMMFTVPTLTISLRMMWHSLVLGEKGQRNLDQISERSEQAFNRIDSLVSEVKSRMGDGFMDEVRDAVRGVKEFVKPERAIRSSPENGLAGFRALKRVENGQVR